MKWNREERATNWQKLCKANTEPETTVPVFQMEIVHGREIKDATYAYVVDCKGEFPQKIPAILANNTHLQAAENPKGTKLGAVYFDTSVTAKGKSEHSRYLRPQPVCREKGWKTHSHSNRCFDEKGSEQPDCIYLCARQR